MHPGQEAAFDDEEESGDESADDDADEAEKAITKVPVVEIRRLAEACADAQHPLESIVVHTKAECPAADRFWFEKNVPKFSWAPVSESDSRTAYWSSVTLEYGPKA